MATQNTEPVFSPFYATIKTISLQKRDGSFSLNISQVNLECQYEKLELSESIQTLFPEGVLVVRDTKDIVSFIKDKNIEIIRFDYINGSYSDYDITAVSYLNNVASETEENFVGIYFSNKYYKGLQTTSLVHYLSYKPLVWKIDDFVKNIATDVLGSVLNDVDLSIATQNIDKNISPTKNYVLYRPLNPSDNRIEHPTDNALQYLNYLSTMACGGTADAFEPRFLFWTNWNNEINFKYFENDIEKNENASDEVLTSKYLRFAISDTNTSLIKLKKKVIIDGEQADQERDYRKIFTLVSDPVNQFISKNYYYIKITPKFLDNTPADLKVNTTERFSYMINALTFNYQDEGQRYNIEMVGNTAGVTFSGFTAGAEQITYNSHWGYYNDLVPLNGRTNITFLGEEFGTQKIYSDMNLAGDTGYMQYVDNGLMWKNMFDITEIHPNYPVIENLSQFTKGITAADTYLQKIIDIRYKVFKKYLEDYEDEEKKKYQRLELMRKIEKQNFIMYVLCCMAKEEESFFALLTRYEKDNTAPTGENVVRVPYRYNWVKLNFNSPYGLTGPSGTTGNFDPNSGVCGPTYWIHQIEKWSKDPLVKGNCFQDDTWAINLNERGLTGGYLPPGWISDLPTSFNWRPIGAADTETGNSGKINHIVKMHAVPMTDLLLDSHQSVPENYIGKYFYYFTATNIVDGVCQ